MKHVAESTLVWPAHRTLEVAMCLGTCINACTYRCHLRTAIEHQDYCLAVPPCGIAQELVDRLAKGLRTLPEFALGYKDVAFALAQQDVGFTLHIERLARGLALKLAVELN